jgi:ATP-dependent RNA helicase RhlE
MSFQQLQIHPALLRAVSACGYERPTEIQQKAIPAALAGRDLVASAQTGTGKTAAFVLPSLHRLHAEPRHRGTNDRRPRMLVLAPTRELAAQVGEDVRDLGKFTQFRSAVIFGGVGYESQTQALRRGLDVLVATPGRLLDHAGQGTADLSSIEILVLDEADRMLDMGFIHDIRKILALLPEKRQNLLFSATFPDEIREIVDSIMDRPERIEAARRTLDADSVSQVVHQVDRERKRELLSHLITSGSWKQVLVFTRTKQGANKLAEQLDTSGIAASAIHGNKSQSARTRALADFKQGRVRVLVATDIAARGIDIDRLPHVVNFELPNVPEDYVHRIGRTGRAGQSGQAVSLVSPEESGLMSGIRLILKREIPVVAVAGFEVRPVSRTSSSCRTERPDQMPARKRRGGFRKGSAVTAGWSSGKGVAADRSWSSRSRKGARRASVVTGFE